MGVRGLGIVALTLMLLLLLVGYVGARQLGWIGRGESEHLCFINYTLAAASGQVWEIHGLHTDVPELRFVVDHVELNPVPDDEPLYPLPHMVAVRGVKDPGQPGFSVQPPPGALVFDRLGAPTTNEWLTEIRNGWELRGKTRVPVVIAEFRSSDGRQSRYFFDPAHPQIPIGWYRQEVLGPKGSEDYLGISRVASEDLQTPPATCAGAGGSH